MVRTRLDASAPDGALIETDTGPDFDTGRDYIFGRSLEAAVNVALAIGRPLLVAGEPGCGKTQLGYAIARKMGVDRVYFQVVKSTSEARDLFYSFDAIGRFHEAQLSQLRLQAVSGTLPQAADFITFQALGSAILDAHEPDDIDHLVKGTSYRHPGRPRKSVEIIDEIDKASRDFPNDLLHEIDRLQFRVPELAVGNTSRVARDGRPPETPGKRAIQVDHRPIIIITSNEERQLPDAFLRRCAFVEIGFPPNDERGRETLSQIVASALAKLMDPRKAGIDVVLPDGVESDLIDILFKFRSLPLDRKPGIAELLDAAKALWAMRQLRVERSELLELVRPTLAKSKGDQARFIHEFGGEMISPQIAD